MDNVFKRTVICFLGVLVVAGCAAYATNMRTSLDDPGGGGKAGSFYSKDGTKQVALPRREPGEGY